MHTLKKKKVKLLTSENLNQKPIEQKDPQNLNPPENYINYCRSAPVKIVIGVSEDNVDFMNMDVIYWELKQRLIATEVKSLT